MPKIINSKILIIFPTSKFDENIETQFYSLEEERNFWRKVMLLILDSNSLFLTFTNIYIRPTFLPSLDTIGSKLQPLERIIVRYRLDYRLKYCC